MSEEIIVSHHIPQEPYRGPVLDKEDRIEKIAMRFDPHFRLTPSEYEALKAAVRERFVAMPENTNHLLTRGFRLATGDGTPYVMGGEKGTTIYNRMPRSPLKRKHRLRERRGLKARRAG